MPSWELHVQWIVMLYPAKNFREQPHCSMYTYHQNTRKRVAEAFMKVTAKKKLLQRFVLLSLAQYSRVHIVGSPLCINIWQQLRPHFVYIGQGNRFRHLCALLVCAHWVWATCKSCLPCPHKGSSIMVHFYITQSGIMHMFVCWLIILWIKGCFHFQGLLNEHCPSIIP